MTADAVRMVRARAGTSIRRLARAVDVPVSTAGRWCAPASEAPSKKRQRPVRDDPELREQVRTLCLEERNQTRGHRLIRALLRRRYGRTVARKTVLGVMKDLGLSQKRLRYKPARPKRVEKMRPVQPNRAWQIDMTSFQLSDLTPLFLEVVIDCCTRKIVGWSLDRRCRAREWIAAVQTALDTQGLQDRADREHLVLRSDNGAQPRSNAFVEYLGTMGIRGQYTGYNAPDDNAFVERVIRTLKEEEIWLNQYDTWAEAHEAIERYVRYYNEERLHSALDYRTPMEDEVRRMTLLAA